MSREILIGDTVRAFHPRMFGVIVYGTVTKLGPTWVYVDFGPIHGGTFKVSRRDIVSHGTLTL